MWTRPWWLIPYFVHQGPPTPALRGFPSSLYRTPRSYADAPSRPARVFARADALARWARPGRSGQKCSRMTPRRARVSSFLCPIIASTEFSPEAEKRFDGSSAGQHVGTVPVTQRRPSSPAVFKASV
ncbi:hypothetical protein BV20DRAFT_445334 [Pilatotrama ljubarskyi]|nr:hypothetical protein BV20DRAFT_445334 [Pilatotrama ljubarskyi]